VGKASLKLDAYDSLQKNFPVKAFIKEGILEFSLQGILPFPKDSLARFRKAKDWKVKVSYHDHTIFAQPKKKDKRAILIDGVSIEVNGISYPILAEFWLPAKVTASPEYTAWRDSLQAQGRLRTTFRGWMTDPRDSQTYPWIRLDSNDWFSRYLSYGVDGSYPCSDRPEHAGCRKYSRGDASSICPAGWGIPGPVEITHFMRAWRGSGPDTANPFMFGPAVWEIADADSLLENGARMLVTPWTGLGMIAPHFWTYLESFATDSASRVGLLQFGWSETGWMSEFNVDENDRKVRPIRCVRKDIPKSEVAPDLSSETLPLPEPSANSVVPMEPVVDAISATESPNTNPPTP
jgi:uncharacterized protein (TIGR02145 family)